MKLTYKKIMIAVCVILFIVIIFLVRKSNNSELSPIYNRHITLGAWSEGLFDGSKQQLHPEKLSAFEKLIQKKVLIAHYYIGWEALANPEIITQFQTLRQNGWEPMLNVNPYYFSDCPATNKPLYRAIAEGNCDDFLHKAAKNMSNVKQPFYLLFAWEMNNDNNSWSVQYSGSTSKDFIAAWKHVYTIFKQEKATNAIWVFCPNIPDDKKVPYTEIYPGDAYVDWIGLDGYNWGTTQSWSKWTTFSDMFKGSYTKLNTIAPNKPMLIAEVNTTDKGGDKSIWLTDMLTHEIPYNFPKVEIVVIFNEDKSKQENVNWKIDINEKSLRAFISAIHTRFYR